MERGGILYPVSRQATSPPSVIPEAPPCALRNPAFSFPQLDCGFHLRNDGN